MQWFTGSIPEAIGESRRRRLVFIVYIDGDNEDTGKMNETWEDHRVAEKLSKDKCVAIKLDSKSEDCKNFSKLYPVVCVPATYFIGETGLPLDVVGGSLPVDEFINRVNKALETYHNSSANNTAQEPVASEASTVVTASQSSSESCNQQLSESSVSLSQDSEPTPGPSQETEESSSSQQEVSLTERVEKAKKLIEQRREERFEKETKGVKKTELSRRNVGQELSKAKRDREERQAKDIVNQIKEDRAKERAHREAVRQQIARDRAEREARIQNEIQERQRMQDASPSAVATGTGETRAKSDCSSARLQFRLPDGSLVTNSFASDVLLEAARQFIVNHLGPNCNSVTMYTTYPRRELTDDDLLKSLAELGLAPSSTLVVATKNKASIPLSTSSSLSDIFLWVLSPLFALMSFLKLLVLGNPDQPRGAYNPGQSRTATIPQSQQSSSSAVRKRVPENSAFTRQEGSVHRLQNRNDDDEDNNTWNGNSTQQM